ncbi:MAG: hypothetical protein KY410_04235 [Proteobacteria bacterium]|nr:hypothetical protein [Pseudomonadota bacterium]
MLEMVVFAAHLVQPPQLEWSERKRLLRERVTAVVAAANEMYCRDDPAPHPVLERLPNAHGRYDHAFGRLSLDLESVNDPGKFWHVINETIAHEWAHHLNRRINASRNHGRDFNALLAALRNGAKGGANGYCDRSALASSSAVSRSR